MGSFNLMTINSVQMWEMMLVGFINVKHASHLKSTHVNSKATGVGGVVGNKGGMQLTFKLYEHIFNFINVHLVHGAKRCEKRHDMMSDLLRNMKVFRDEIDSDNIADFSFILGDLNYRMNSTFTELLP